MQLFNWFKKQPPDSPTTEESPPLFQLLNSLNDVVLVLNEQSQIEFINSCWLTVSGFTLTKTLNRPFSNFLHPEDLPNWNQLIQRLRPSSKETLWIRIITSDNDIRWCELRIQTMATDSIFPLSATLCDITPQMRHDQSQQAHFRSLQSLVDRMPAMIYRARNNTSWTMEYVSNGCERVLGITADKLVNKTDITVGSMIHPDDVTEVWDNVQHAIKTHSLFNLSYRITRPNGEQVTVQDKGHGIYSESGMILGVEGILFEI
jgi:PAS domain S-box-containing protein